MAKVGGGGGMTQEFLVYFSTDGVLPWRDVSIKGAL